MLTTELIPARDAASRRSMVVLHGLGDSMEGYRWLPQMLRLPWLNYLLVNAPASYFGGFSWYDFTALDPGLDIAASRKLLFDLLDKQRADGFPAEETILFGFSQGCLMTLEAGWRYPRKFAGLVGVSGYAHRPELLSEQSSRVALEQRFLLTHGTQDALIPVQRVREQIALLKAAGAQIDWREFAKDHTIAGEEELAVIRDFIRARFE